MQAELIPVADVAKRVGLAPVTIVRMSTEGRESLPALVRIGRRNFFNRVAAEAWVAGKVGATA